MGHIRDLKVAEHSFQVPMPNSPLLLNYLCFGAHFLHESRLITDVTLIDLLASRISPKPINFSIEE